MVRRSANSNERFKIERTKHVAIVIDPWAELPRVQMITRNVLNMLLLGG